MAGLVTVTTPVTGTPISSTTFGIPVSTNLTVLANPPLAKLRNSTTQSIATGTNTAITWDTEDFDTVNGHSTVTNTSRYTCQTGYAGYYSLSAIVWFAASAAGVQREMWFQLNGAVINGSATNALPSSANVLSMASNVIVLMAATDYVEVFVVQDSGGALLTSQAFPRRAATFQIEWIHQ